MCKSNYTQVICKDKLIIAYRQKKNNKIISNEKRFYMVEFFLHLEVQELSKGGHQLGVRRPLVSSLEPTFFGHGLGDTPKNPVINLF